MFFGFAFRVALVLVPILVMGIAITSALSLHKFGQTFSNLLDSRFEFVTGQIRNDIETQMDLGLPLENLQITEVLEAYGLDDRQILSIEVFDESGLILHSSDSSSIGDLIPEEWISIWRLNASTGNPSWFTQETDAGVVGTPIRNNLGQDVGSLVLRYSRDYLDQKIRSQARHLLVVNSAAAGIAILIAFFSAMYLLNQVCREFKSMGEVMDTISSDRQKDISALRETGIRHPAFHRFISAILVTYKDMESTIIRARNLDEGKER
ncbi:MAG: hypothetical protein F4Z15_01670 [Gammaproteobacteria bacterium]|nr:hypothetical protein [Gammaproteobacteria bacterium]MYD76022.1 hypothetical protein [Gammaproteobacteria bacterium]MYJ53270.1 hypothetical protein [Gammaproteobacteria bacterium]